MREKISSILEKFVPLKKSEINDLIEIPPSLNLGDYALPCFILSKKLKKEPAEIAKELARKIKSKEFEKIEANGPYLNFFIDSRYLTEQTLSRIVKEREKYGSSNIGKGKKILIEMSSPNIAKPFGIGHLRSTIIGNSISNICSFLGYKTIRLNYLGDWGTSSGKILAGYKHFGSEKALKLNPLHHLYDIYVKTSKDEKFEELGRQWFKKLESGDKEAVKTWRKFREISVKEFNKIYKSLDIKFDVISGESLYDKKINSVVLDLKKKDLIKRSEGADIIDLNKYALGVALVRKSDGTTLYVTRDIAAAIDRYKKYKFERMFYEVGQEQKLHFKQLFKILELLGCKWVKSCAHIDHGLYLDKDGRKFATRTGKTVFMADILEETKKLAKIEISKRGKLPIKYLEKRAQAIAIASIFYGDLKNHRSNDIVFDINRFVSFEGNTGPYLLYTYARARNILRKAKYNPKLRYKIEKLSDAEKSIISELNKFGEVVYQSYISLSPNLIANYAYTLSQIFNEFYHSCPVIGSENEQFRLALVDSTSQVIKNSLNLLGISTLESL
ncbi:MAG: arginine--tRNA ligase [Nanoarchaeota archaeon]